MPAARYHPAFVDPPDPSVRIWRYMDFTKLVAMLEYEGLFFVRSDKLGEPFEGSLPLANDRFFDDVHRRELDMVVKDDPQKRKRFEDSVSRSRNVVTEWRPWMLVNCWHMKNHESAAMWKIYAESERSICIQSSYEKLQSVLPSDVYTGVVQYKDYGPKGKEPIDEDQAFRRFMHKRCFFDDETEVRAVLPITPLGVGTPPELGQWRRIELGKLVDRIVISPQSPAWFLDLVKAVVARYGLQIPVEPSALDRKPRW